MGTKQKPVVWVVNTSAVGDLRAAQGVAAKINPEFTIHDILGKTPAEIKIHCIKEFGTSRLRSNPKWPDFLISSGKNASPAAIQIKNLSGGKVFTIQNLPPEKDTSSFDLIIIPEHRINDRLRDLRNHIGTIGVPHFLTEEKIVKEKDIWAARFANLPSPRIGVLVGGKAGSFTFTQEAAAKLADEINKKTKELGGSLIISTSRRTDLVGTEQRSSRITEAFMSRITVPNYTHIWSPDTSENPYLGILGCADAIIVTGDSMSMCCEANISRKPVYICSFDTLRKGFSILHKQLYEHDLAKPFQTFLDEGIVPWEYEPLDTAGFIAQEAISRWKKMRPQKQSNETAISRISSQILSERSLEMANSLLSASIQGLDSIQGALKSDKDFQQAFFQTVKLLRNTNHGRILITGIGKSLRVGQLVAASWDSLSIPCESLDPLHAVHGDMGKMLPEAGDVLIVISKSGNLDENLEKVLSEAVDRGYKIVAVTHNQNSSITETVSKLGTKGIILKIPSPNEPHPFANEEGKVSPPTVSTTQVKVLLEAIGLALAKLRGMQKDDFQKNHPAGALGKNKTSPTR